MEQVNWVSIGFGITFWLYGLFTLLMRQRKPSIFRKLEPMKKLWGEQWGVRIHFFGYTVMPIIFGSVFVWAGLNGQSIF